MQSPAGTPENGDCCTPIKRKYDESSESNANTDTNTNTNNKRPTLATPDRTDGDVNLDVDVNVVAEVDAPPKKITKRELQKIENHKRRVLEKKQKDQQREQERLIKEQLKKSKAAEKDKRMAEKEMEKQAKRIKLEEDKKKKELERLKKEEEKLERDRIKLEKKLRDEEEKKRLEEEKRKAEEEKKRNEDRNQKKISNFFKVKVQSTTPKKAIFNHSLQGGSPSNKGSNAILIEDMSQISDYEKDFLPFFIQKNVTLADNGQLTGEQKDQSITRFDESIKSNEASDLKSFFNSLNNNDINPTHSQSITPDDIINELNSSTTSETIIYQLIQKLPPIKYLQFYENSKPPYIGTWCSLRHQNIHIPIGNPTDTELTGFDYDYDSDLEWNNKEDGDEEEDGEDVDDDEDDEEEPNLDDDDMLDFVEDNNLDQNNKAKKFHSLIVINKWNDGTNQDIFDKLISVPLIAEITEGPIDPNTDYWNPTANEPSIVSIDVHSPQKPLSGTASNPPTASASDSASASTSATPNILIPQKKTIQDAAILGQLIVFIENNNDFSIQTLVELSKKQFKEFTKALLKNTIQEIATYNKKTSNWDVKPELRAKYVV